MRTTWHAIVILGLWACGACAADAGSFDVYRGASDASAAVAIDEDHFVVADDEDNVLRVYRLGEPGLPVLSVDVSAFLRCEEDHPEADIEGATRVGDRIYWITSHGRNKDGKPRPNRYRFFATDVRVVGDRVEITPAGRPCRNLVLEMVHAPFLRALDIEQFTRLGAMDLSKDERKSLAPKEGGLNIEALAADPQGRTLWIGLRNPTYRSAATGRREAVVIPLLNANEVVEEGRPPRFGAPLRWDLGGLGVRSVEYCRSRGAYYIVAGPRNGSDALVLYRWSGGLSEAPERVHVFNEPEDFTPEALFETPRGVLYVLSDDGTLEIDVDHPRECMEGELLDNGRCPNKFLADPNRKTFRGLRMRP